MQRFIIEMGMGNDLHGQNYTKAAVRAVEDAIRHSSIPLLGALNIDHREMRVQVTVGVQKPDAVEIEAVASGLPSGNVSVSAIEGGLDIINPDSGDVTVVATAAVEAFLPSGLVRTNA